MAFIQLFEQHLATLPDNTRTVVEPVFRHYCQQYDASALSIPDDPDIIASVVKVWACSPFVAGQCLRKPEMLDDLVTSGDLLEAKDEAYYRERLAAYPVTNETELMTVLRRFRNREMVRIAWRDLAGWADLQETLHELSWLAEVCISHALDFLYQQACQQYGTPVFADGSPQQMIVLGMGKLGAWELNFSSDIDLIMAYLEEGELNDRKQTSYGEFFIRVARRLVKVLDEKTVDGFVFRVDTRLRPFGDSGPLVMSFDGMENYYHTQAREWERYAMIKARQIAGDFAAGEQLFDMLNPFIYRRYLDYGAFSELRCLKLKISDGLKRKNSCSNIKLGAGGIREVEFIGQAFQLIRGGRDSELQERRLLWVLSTLAELKQIDSEEIQRLKQSYCFLRRVENRLQQYQDQQTHELPVTAEQQQLLAYALDYPDWPSFKADLEQVQLQVQAVFAEVFSVSEDQTETSEADSLWSDSADPESVSERLREMGFAEPEQSRKNLENFKTSGPIGRLPHKGVDALARLLPELIRLTGRCENPDQTLARILTLLEKIAGRSVYLALLAENPEALKQLVELSSASDWICRYLGKHPVIYDELLDSRTLYQPLSKDALTAQLAEQLALYGDQDIEQVMIVMREFKQVNVLKVAAADIMGAIPLMVVSDYLSYIAEVLLEQALQWLWRLLLEKHGAPPGAGDQVKGFGVIGMGKLGGYELGYGSDLDLVFLHDCDNGNAMTDGAKPISCSQFYVRLGQRLMTMFNTRMLSGVLYEVDMRLRPNGNSGLLVNHIDAYREYLQKQAWTWEHQAIIRGRFVAGDPVVAGKFDEIRAQILSLARTPTTLKHEVRDMREKMRANLEKATAEQFHLKQSIGGIADIEFIVQFKVLENAEQHRSLTRYTDIIRILADLKENRLIDGDDAQLLEQAYCCYRDRGHRQVLQGEQVVIDKREFAQISEQVAAIWQKIMLDE